MITSVAATGYIDLRDSFQNSTVGATENAPLLPDYVLQGGCSTHAFSAHATPRKLENTMSLKGEDAPERFVTPVRWPEI
jgi:hypothetical protein